MDEFSFFTELEPVYEIDFKWYAHAIPHRLDPLPAEDAEDDHEAVHEVCEVPSRHHFLREPLHVVWNTLELSDDFPGRPPENLSLCDQKFITAHFTIRPTCIAFAEELHAHDSEDEDDDTEDECEVSQSTNGFPHNGDEEVERRPGLGQLEHSQLGKEGGGQVGVGDNCDEDESLSWNSLGLRAT